MRVLLVQRVDLKDQMLVDWLLPLFDVAHGSTHFHQNRPTSQLEH